jgi:hypothetical protein
MISIKRHGMLGRRLGSLLGAVLAVAAAGPSMALAASPGKHQQGQARGAQQMQPPINAQTDPAAAAAAVEAGGSVSNISWQTNTAPGGCEGAVPAPAPPVQPAPCVPAQNNQAHYAITDGWGPPAVFGDVLYNCSQTADAETDTGDSDTRTQSWSLSEKVSLKISAGLPNIVSVSDEVSAFSKQANSSATTVTVTNGVTVPPGFKGWTTTEVQTLTVPGTAYVTDPLRNTITPVQDIDLSFPGYSANPLGSQTSWTGHTVAMTANDIHTICNTNPVNVAARHYNVVGTGLTVRRPSSFVLRVCDPMGPCRARTVTGPLPPSRIRRATARLTRAGHIYGRGTYTRGHTQVHMSRALRPGTYRLTLREPSQRVGAGAQHAIETILPVTVG